MKGKKRSAKKSLSVSRRRKLRRLSVLKRSVLRKLRGWLKNRRE